MVKAISLTLDFVENVQLCTMRHPHSHHPKRHYYGAAIALPNPETAMNHPLPQSDHLTLEGYVSTHCPLAWERYENYHRENCNGIPRLSKHKALELFVSSGVSPQAVLDFNNLCKAKGWQ